MAALGLTPLTAAKAAGLPRDTFRNMFRDNSSMPRADTLISMARALKTSVSYLVGEASTPEIGRLELADADTGLRVTKPIPLYGPVSRPLTKNDKGEWYHGEPALFLTMEVPGFEGATLSAFVVDDQTMSPIFQTGSIVISGRVDATGFKSGDYLIVSRRSATDQAAVRSVRQLKFVNDQMFFQTPPGSPEPESWCANDVDVFSIFGVVVAQLAILISPSAERGYLLAALEQK
jgi:transcriptional regulator with XRE-family HTH domain